MRRHRSILTVVLITTTLAITSTSPAQAGPGKGKWHPAPDQPAIQVQACGTTVAIDEKDNRLRERITETATSFRIEQRGHLTVSLVAADGRSAVINASGAADYLFTEGKNHLEFRGRNLLVAANEELARQHKNAGLPTIAVAKGRVVVDEVVDPSNGNVLSGGFTSLPKNITDACTLLRR